MSVSSPSLRVLAIPVPNVHLRGAALLAGCAAVDAVAAGIVLLGTPLPRPLAFMMAAALHLAAVVLLWGLTAARPSQRWLSSAALLAVPFVGAAIAVAILVTTGRGTASIGRHRRSRRRAPPTRAELRTNVRELLRGMLGR